MHKRVHTPLAHPAAVKQHEFEEFMRVISPWEREYLLLNV